MSLFDCILNEVLDMDRAARLIFDQKQRGDFDQAEYDVITTAYIKFFFLPSYLSFFLLGLRQLGACSACNSSLRLR